MGDDAERRATETASRFRPSRESGRQRREPTGAFTTGAPVRSQRVVSIRLRGHVDERAVSDSLGRGEETLDRLGRARIMIDCRRVEGWHGASRDRVVRWARSQRDRVDRVAVVTEDFLWTMGLRTSSLASRQSMRGFTDIEAAFDWLSAR